MATTAAEEFEVRAGPGPAEVLVNGEWVRERTRHGWDMKVIDCSWFMVLPPVQHVPVIPGVAFFDVDEVANRAVEAGRSPHMLPSAHQLANWMEQHGITRSDRLLLYDHSDGLMIASARVWWTLRVYGHTHVHVLQGGHACWPADVSIPVEFHIPSVGTDARSHPTYVPTHRAELVWNQNHIMEFIVNRQKSPETAYKLLDARPAERFYGVADEPRRGVPSGSIPGAVSLPFTELLLKTDVTDREGHSRVVYVPRSRKELTEIFSSRGIDITNPPSGPGVVAMCGSGITACTLTLILCSLGYPEAPIYDGSWTEWAFTSHPKQYLQQLPPDVVALSKYHH